MHAIISFRRDLRQIRMSAPLPDHGEHFTAKTGDTTVKMLLSQTDHFTDKTGKGRI